MFAVALANSALPHLTDWQTETVPFKFKRNVKPLSVGGTYNTLFLGYAQLILVFCQIFQAAGNFWNSQVRCADNCDSAQLTQFMGKQNSNKIFLFCLRSVVALVVVMISTATEFPIEIFHSC